MRTPTPRRYWIYKGNCPENVLQIPQGRAHWAVVGLGVAPTFAGRRWQRGLRSWFPPGQREAPALVHPAEVAGCVPCAASRVSLLQRPRATFQAHVGVSVGSCL